MAVPLNELPASSQLSSILSDTPPSSSDQETLGEITVDLSSTTISPHHHHRQTSPSPKNNSEMTRKKTTVPTTQPTRQSKRQIKKPAFLEAVSSGDELVKGTSCNSSKNSIPAKRGRADSTTKSASRKPDPKPAKRTKPTLIRGAKRWEPEFVTQNSKSPLVTADVDLRTLLLQPVAWDVLSPENQREILALMPSDTHILEAETPNARPNIGALVNNDTFRHDAEEYVSNISRGMHNPDWLKDAWAAHQRRTVGDFDEFYIRKIEVDWSADIPDEHRPEHLRGKKKCGASASADEQEASLTGAPVAGVDDSGQNGEPAQSGSVKDGEDVTSTKGSKERSPKRKTCHDASNGTKERTPKRKSSHGASSVAGSITPTAEKPTVEKYTKSNGSPRFAPMIDETEVDKAADHKGITNGISNDTTNAVDDAATKATGDKAGLDNKITNGEITVGGKLTEENRLAK